MGDLTYFIKFYDKEQPNLDLVQPREFDSRADAEEAIEESDMKVAEAWMQIDGLDQKIRLDQEWSVSLKTLDRVPWKPTHLSKLYSGEAELAVMVIGDFAYVGNDWQEDPHSHFEARPFFVRKKGVWRFFSGQEFKGTIEPL